MCRAARWVGVAAIAVTMLAVPVARAQDSLDLGDTAADQRVQATLTSTGRADRYQNLVGPWFVADVELVGVGGIDANALLDWRLDLPDGSRLVPFPSELANPPDGTVGPGVSATIRLGFQTTAAGPGQLVYQPFLDADPLGVWTVTIEPPVAATEPTVVIPALSVPNVSVLDGGVIPVPEVSLGVEQVRSFTARYDIQADTTILVTETIVYDFGFEPRRGIFRDLALFQPIDDDRERQYPISEVSVDAAAGTPADFEILRVGDYQRIKIGDPDITITGVHTYTLRYRLAGSLNPRSGGPELYFNVTGTWAVDMDEVNIEVAAPGGVDRVACFSGVTGSMWSCGESTIDDDGVARFRQDALRNQEQLTIVAALPAGSVVTPQPILGPAPRDWSDAVEPDLTNVGGAATVMIAGLLGIGTLVWRKGRDLESSGSHIDARFAPDGQPARRLPILRRVETPVEFEPPEGVRPGLLGTLYDERADAVDVSASIVDLAVRGFLRIEETEGKGLFGTGLFADDDHRLVLLREDDGTLMPYERMLLKGLFTGSKSEVQLSDLKDSFASTLTKIRDSMYAETVRQRWFERRPDKARSRWLAIGAAILAAGAGAVALAAVTRYAVWPAAALALVGLVFLVAARRMPRRSARGTAALRHVEGFRRFIVESESRRSEFDERKNLFTEYLPYAIVFGCVDKWATTFADLQTGELPDTGSWYVGTHRFDAGSFSKSVNGFATVAGSTMSSTPGGSGSSGFSGGSSGGGGGGGGGGSW